MSEKKPITEKGLILYKDYEIHPNKKYLGNDIEYLVYKCKSLKLLSIMFSEHKEVIKCL